jgi:hypothetical protein
MEKMNCEQAKQIDLVDYLSSLGHHPQKIRNQDYWYLSPLRDERTASFKINRKLNVWYDHGMGKGGDMIDFGTSYHKCSIGDLLQKLSGYHARPGLSFHPPVSGAQPSPASRLSAGEKKDSPAAKIVIVDVRPLAEKCLYDYLQKRCIPIEIAASFCKEVDFLLYEKKHRVIGFRNNSGGYELRSENFKGSSSPKDVSFFNNDKQEVAVFEGFFSYLAFETLNKNQNAPLTNFLILNSLSFFEKSRQLMQQHDRIHLFLDRDIAGKKCTGQALEWNQGKYIDRSSFYQNRKDLNQWLIHHQLNQEQRPRISRGL